MSIFVLKIRDYLIDSLDIDVLPEIDEGEKEELEVLSANAIGIDYIPAYIYFRQYHDGTIYIASTTGAWSWMVHRINESIDIEKLLQIGYKRFTKNIFVKWMGYAGFSEAEIDGTLAWILLRLINKQYETLRIISL